MVGEPSLLHLTLPIIMKNHVAECDEASSMFDTVECSADPGGRSRSHPRRSVTVLGSVTPPCLVCYSSEDHVIIAGQPRRPNLFLPKPGFPPPPTHECASLRILPHLSLLSKSQTVCPISFLSVKLNIPYLGMDADSSTAPLITLARPPSFSHTHPARWWLTLFFHHERCNYMALLDALFLSPVSEVNPRSQLPGNGPGRCSQKHILASHPSLSSCIALQSHQPLPTQHR